MYDLLPNNFVVSIAKNFQKLIDNYNPIENNSSISAYEAQIAQNYHGQDLYCLICNLKELLTDDNNCKSHIISFLENSLIAEILATSPPNSNVINSFIALGINIIEAYASSKDSIATDSLKSTDFDQAVEGIYDYIKQVQELSIIDRMAILNGLYNHYLEKLSGLPKAVLSMLKSIKESALKEYGLGLEINTVPKNN